MRTTNIPGFTASTSLYRSHASYLVGSRANRSFGSSNSVEAAAAIYVNGLFYCYGEVTGSGVSCYGGGVSGPTEPLCRPFCGPCRNGVKFCIQRNCDDVEIPC